MSTSISIKNISSTGGVSFATLGEVVDRTGVLNGIPVPLAKEWVSTIRQNGPPLYTPSDVGTVLNALSGRVGALRGVDAAVIRSFVEVRRGHQPHHKGSGGSANHNHHTTPIGRYMPRGIDGVSKWLLHTLQHHQGDLDTAAMGVCRGANIPAPCTALIQTWYSFAATTSNANITPSDSDAADSETSAAAVDAHDVVEQQVQSRLLWVLMRAVGAVLSPASDVDVSQELAFQLFSDYSSTTLK